MELAGKPNKFGYEDVEAGSPLALDNGSSHLYKQNLCTLLVKTRQHNNNPCYVYKRTGVIIFCLLHIIFPVINNFKYFCFCELLKESTRDDYSEIYMFFDYNGHNNNIPKDYTGKDILGKIKVKIFREVINMDVLTKEQRRKNMQHIKGKNTSIEIMLCKALWQKGYHYRKNYKELPGSPDIVLTKYKIAIFCDGEFFHGKDWDKLKARLEKGEKGEYWIKKITKNMERDEEINKQLIFKGWTVLRFWGDDIKKNTGECVKVIEETIFDISTENKLI